MFSEIYGLNRAQTKNEIRDHLISEAVLAGSYLSKSRANNLADQYKKGLLDGPDLMTVINYSDPTGEKAVRNVLREVAA